MRSPWSTLIVASLAVLQACGGPSGSQILSGIAAPDCAASAKGPWRVGSGGNELQLILGESHQESVTPGLPVECAGTLRSVTWSVENPVVASVTQLGPKNAPNDTAGDISRAWVTGLAPGLTMVKARIVFTDGEREAQPEAVRVVPPAAPPQRSFLIAQGTADITVGSLGEGDSELIPVTVPAAGRVDISVDWTSFQNSLGFFLWQGRCSAVPCPGAPVVNAQAGLNKPRRDFADNLAAGEYTLRIFAIGAGNETARYEVRLTPN